jgi:hypothetical protein
MLEIKYKNTAILSLMRKGICGYKVIKVPYQQKQSALLIRH